MPPDRIDAIELDLRRSAMDGPVDSRQRLVGIALEVVAAWHRATEMRRGAEAVAERRLADLLKLGALLREAVALLKGADTMTAEWVRRRDWLVEMWRNG